jgi:hypothetical protein
VPVYEHLLIEAPSFEEACRSAIDESEQPWGDDTRADYESARPTTIARAVELPGLVRAGDAGEDSLSHFLYGAGLDPLPIQREFTEEIDDPGISVGFV